MDKLILVELTDPTLVTAITEIRGVSTAGQVYFLDEATVQALGLPSTDKVMVSFLLPAVPVIVVVQVGNGVKVQP